MYLTGSRMENFNKYWQITKNVKFVNILSKFAYKLLIDWQMGNIRAMYVNIATHVYTDALKKEFVYDLINTNNGYM